MTATTQTDGNRRMHMAISMDTALCLVHAHHSSMHVLLLAVVSTVANFTVVMVAVTPLVTILSSSALLLVLIV